MLNLVTLLQICVHLNHLFPSCCTIKEKAVGSYGWLGLGTGMRGPQVIFFGNMEGLIVSCCNPIILLLVDVAAHMCGC